MNPVYTAQSRVAGVELGIDGSLLLGNSVIVEFLKKLKGCVG